MTTKKKKKKRPVYARDNGNEIMMQTLFTQKKKHNTEMNLLLCVLKYQAQWYFK